MADSPVALIVDDEPDLRELLAMGLAKIGVQRLDAWNLASAHRLIASAKTIDICFTDVRLPDGSGIDIVQALGEQRAEVPAIVITAYGTIEMTVQAMKAGAYDFLCKPLSLKHLQRIARDALGSRQAADSAQAADSEWAGSSAIARTLRQRVEELAATDAPLYLVGKPSSGRQWLACAVHARSALAGAPFIAVPCALLAPEQVDAKLFGSGQGGGLLAEARNGTLFLDELCRLPLTTQERLHTELAQSDIRRLIASDDIGLERDALHPALAELFDAERLQIPSLNERRVDVPAIAQRILDRLGRQQDSHWELTEGAGAMLQERSWTGGINQLITTLQQATLIVTGERINAADLPADQCPGQVVSGQIPGDFVNLQQIETQAIARALEEHQWNRAAAARRLGLTSRQLRYKIRKYGLLE